MRSNSGASGPVNSSQLFERNPSVGNPRPASSFAALRGAARPWAWLPALNAVKRPAPSWFEQAFAMIERAELPVHRNSTVDLTLSFSGICRSAAGGCWGAALRRATGAWRRHCPKRGWQNQGDFAITGAVSHWSGTLPRPRHRDRRSSSFRTGHSSRWWRLPPAPAPFAACRRP
jgi:hypothetical protein